MNFRCSELYWFFNCSFSFNQIVNIYKNPILFRIKVISDQLSYVNKKCALRLNVNKKCAFINLLCFHYMIEIPQQFSSTFNTWSNNVYINYCYVHSIAHFRHPVITLFDVEKTQIQSPFSTTINRYRTPHRLFNYLSPSFRPRSDYGTLDIFATDAWSEMSFALWSFLWKIRRLFERAYWVNNIVIQSHYRRASSKWNYVCW